MRIECGDYTLKSDQMNFWIEKKKTSKKSGDEYGDIVTGYCPTIPHLLNSFAERKFRGSDATNMKELMQELKDAESDLKALAASLGEQFKGVKPCGGE